MTTQHTPGPWNVLGTYVTAAYGKNDIIDVADCERCAVLPLEEQFANARLIAAAPELLEATIKAENLLRRLAESGAKNPELEILRAAIAKATKS